MKKVIIAGAGITGLTCALELARKGHQVSIYEQSNTVGGLTSSFQNNGFVYDFGPHEFCTRNPRLVKLLKELLGEDFLVRKKKEAQHFQQAFIDYPLTPWNLVREISKTLMLKVATEVIANRFKLLVYSYSDYSFRQWVESRFGPTLYAIYFGPYTQKVWGVDPDSLDARTASNRISFNSIFDFLVKTIQHFLLGREDYSSIHSPLKDHFYYSKGGIGTLIHRIEERCRSQGVTINLNHSLVRTEVDGNRIKRLYFQNGAAAEGLDYFVNTTPVTCLLESLGVNISFLPLMYRSIVFVFLEVPQRPVTRFSWIYFPEKEICFQRLTEFTHIDSTMAPEGKSGLCLEISCFKGDEIWNITDNAITERVRKDLDAVGVLPSDIECRAHVVRIPFAYPIQVAGYMEIVHSLLTPIRRLTNAVTIGRQGLYKYCNMNECMEMAIQAAEEIDVGTDTFTYSTDSRWKGAGLENERV